MANIAVFKAKTKFGELLERVAHGEEIVITRHDKPIACIIPEARPSLEEVKAAVAQLRSLRREMAARKSFKPVTDREIRKAIERGRK